MPYDKALGDGFSTSYVEKIASSVYSVGVVQPVKVSQHPEVSTCLGGTSCDRRASGDIESNGPQQYNSCCFVETDDGGFSDTSARFSGGVAAGQAYVEGGTLCRSLGSR